MLDKNNIWDCLNYFPINLIKGNLIKVSKRILKEKYNIQKIEDVGYSIGIILSSVKSVLSDKWIDKSEFPESVAFYNKKMYKVFILNRIVDVYRIDIEEIE